MSVATPIPFEAAGLNLHQSVEFIQALFQPDDTICVVAIKNVTGQVRQNFLVAMDYPATVGKMCAGNDNGWSYYICMNPLILDAKNRTKENVAEIRHAYIEVDDNGTACLNKIKAELPTPAFILRSSRKGDFDAAKQKMNSDDKYQFIWKVTGFKRKRRNDCWPG